MLTTLESDIKNNNNYNNVPRAFSKVSVLIVLLLFVYLSGLNIQMYLRNKTALNVEQLYKKRLQHEQDLNRDLKNQILLFSESEFLERLIREKLGMVKPGETAYRIVDK